MIVTLVPCEYYLPACWYIPCTDTFWGCISQCSQQVWSSSTLAWKSLRLGLGRYWTPPVIFRTLSPICTLSVVGHYFVSSAVIWIFVLYKLYSWLVGVVLYIFSVVVAEYLWSVVMFPTSWQPGIAYYADLGGNAEIRIVLDPGVSQMVSETQVSDSRCCFDTNGYRSNGSAKPIG